MRARQAATVDGRSRGVLTWIVIAVLMLLLAFSVASHEVPFSMSLKPLAIGTPCLVAAAQAVRLGLLSRNGRIVKTPVLTILKLGSTIFSAVILILAAFGFASVSLGNSSGCPSGVSGTCYKVAAWKIQDGMYYTLYPYDKKGDKVADAQWVQISESEYLSAAGADLRQAIGFGIGIALFAYFMILAEGASVTKPGVIVGSPPTSLGL